MTTPVVCKLLDLGHAGLGHVELGQRDWDMRNWDSGTGTSATRTAGLGHAELGQRYWDSFYNVKMGKDCDLCVSFVACVAR